MRQGQECVLTALPLHHIFAFKTHLPGFLVIAAVLGWLPDGSVSAGMETVTQWPVPAWLAPWVDPAWLGLVMQSVRDAVQWLEPWLPSADTLAGVVSALAWGVWALGALGMLLVAAGVHWWARRR